MKKLRKIKQENYYTKIKSTTFVDHQNELQGQRFVIHRDGEIVLFRFKNSEPNGIQIRIL